jgi:hypothetical protein
MLRLTQWNPTPKISAAMIVPFTRTSSRSAPPSRRGRVSDGWIGARRASSMAPASGYEPLADGALRCMAFPLRHTTVTIQPLCHLPSQLALMSKYLLKNCYILPRCHDATSPVLEAAATSGEMQRFPGDETGTPLLV